MPSANEDIVQSFLRHAVDLERFKAGERVKALRILKSLEDDVVVLLAKGAGTAWTKARLRALLSQVRETIYSAYDKMRDKIEQDLQIVADIETSFVANALNGGINVNLVTVEFSAAQLKSVVSDAVIEGGPQAEWWDRQAVKTEQAFGDMVRKGVLSGTPTDEIARDVRQTLFRSQLTRNIEALVRTSVASVADDARTMVFEENDDVIAEVMQHSTLDSRTTPICMAYSGKRWRLPDYQPVGHNLPYNDGVPRHWGCRSVIVPVVPIFDAFGDPASRPNSAKAERAFTRRLREMDFSQAEIKRAMMSAQASMDGYVPESLDYESWLRTKPESFQIEMLGEGKWKLWQAGKISFSDLVDQSGNALTLEQLREGAA